MSVRVGKATGAHSSSVIASRSEKKLLHSHPSSAQAPRSVPNTSLPITASNTGRPSPASQQHGARLIGVSRAGNRDVGHRWFFLLPLTPGPEPL